jgi:two-component system sensor histidine kinase KdpD
MSFLRGGDHRVARPGGLAADLILAGLGAMLVTLVGRWSAANAATAGFLFLLLVLGLSVRRGLGGGLAASVAATLCYNLFFLSPVGTLTIADPANWVALGTFLVTSVVASRLVVHARSRAEEAQRSATETQILYDLGFGLFTSTSRLGTVGDATATCLRTIGAEGGGLVLFHQGSDAPVLVSAIGPRRIDPGHPALARVAERREVLLTEEDGGRMAYVPLQVGEAVIGVLIVSGSPVAGRILESAGRLMALAVERERLLAETTHLEALKASDGLKTSLLRAVSHDLRTPLTAIRLEMEALGRRLRDRPDLTPFLTALSRERERVTRRIDDLLTLARLESGIIEPHPEPTPVGTLFQLARESLSAILAERTVVVRIDPACPDLYVDPALALEVIVNLLENGARVASSDLPLELAAAPDLEDASRMRIEILDRGPGVPPTLRNVLLGPSARHAHTGPADSGGGLGLEIATGLARALGGGLALLPRPGGGTIARIVLPAAALPAPARAVGRP